MPVKNHNYLSVAVAIPTYNREKVLCDTIAAVLNQEYPANEILIIDQTKEHTPETLAFLNSLQDSNKIRWLKQESPNLPAARNRALRETNSQVVIFIDDDVRLTKNFVKHHITNYADFSVVGVAGQTIQAKPCKRTKRPKTWARKLDYKYFPLDSNQRVEGIVSFIGCNHSVRREAALRVGGYDANYIGWAYREDGDMALRLWQAGGLIVFDPMAALTHLVVPSGGCRREKQFSFQKEWRFAFPELYFMRRHFFPKAQFFKFLFFEGVRIYMLNKPNVLHPWRLPISFGAYIYALYRVFHTQSSNIAKNRALKFE